jgi:transcriptional regulator with XRE-family HTH domain
MTEQNQEFIRRFDKLRLFKNWTIAEAAQALGLSRTMIHWLKKGRYEVTEKNWMKLHKAEVETGFAQASESAPPIKEHTSGIRSAVDSAAQHAKIHISPEDIDRGVVDLPLIYRRGEPPAGFPARLKIRTPDVNAAAKIVTAIRADEDFTPLFKACLEEKYAEPKFLDLLSPFTYESLREVCLTMTLGRNWKKVVPEIATAKKRE